MSYLDKLSIEGIRSFKANEFEVIKFFPLTVILGPNGAGKTSIIESLKYVTTGLTPPNSNGGKTFVRDPVLDNTTTTRAQVKLKFNDIEKKSTVVTRSLETSLKRVRGKNQLTFKQLNSVIKRDDKTIDQRCSDINNEMLTLLGVSKAVLSNVIFCHQEDCNWPLSEGKVLKEKFDDIFGSMGYVKALEKIKKLRQSEGVKQKLLEKDVIYSKQLRDEAESKKKRLNGYKSALAVHKEEINDCEKELEKIKSELSEILGKEESAQQMANKIAKIQGSIQAKQTTLKDIKISIHSLFSGTEDELNLEIENFETNAQNSKEKKNSLISQQSNVSRKCSKLIESQQNMAKELAKLQVGEEQYKALINKRTQKVAKICSETSLSMNSDIISKIDSKQQLESKDISIVLKQLNCQLIDLNKQLNDQKSVRQQKFEVLSKELNRLTALKSNYEHEVQLKETELDNKQASLTDIQRKITKSGLSESQYNAINDDIKRLSDQIKQMEKFDIETTKTDLIRYESEKKKLKSDINILEEKLKKIHEQNQERTKLEMLKKDKDEKEVKAKQISEVHNDVMQRVGAIEGEFHSSLDNQVRTLSLLIDKKQNTVSKSENQLTSQVTRVEIQKESIRKKKQHLNELQSKVKKICQFSDYEKTLNKAENELKELRTQLSEIGSFEPFFKKQIDCIKSTDSCPVCERDMTVDWNAKSGNQINKKEVLQKLENFVTQTPDTVEELNKKIKQQESHCSSLLSLRSDIQTIKDLTEEIPKLENELKQSVEENNNQKNSIDKQKLEINKQKSELNSLQSVLQVASDYDNCFKDIKDLEYKINCINGNFDFEECESLQDITNDLQQNKDQYEEIDSQISKNQEIIAKHSESYNKLRNDLQNAERKKLENEREQQEKISNIKKKAELENEIKLLDQNIIDLQMKAMALSPEIDEIDSQKTDLTNELRELEQKIQSKIQIIKEIQKDIERFNLDIDAYKQSGKSDEIVKLNLKLSEINKEISETETNKLAISEQIDKLSAEISNFEVRKRELNDNLKVFTYEKEINDQKNALESERKKLGFQDIEALKRKRRELEKEEKKLDGIRQQSMGKQIPIIESMTQFENELKKPQYKNADTVYKEKSIELAISDISGEDLNKYYKALDYAVSAFHRKKMEEINKLIQGFWKQAYRGTDIDYIKIAADQEERSANDRRRNYNYRVVMVKGVTEMDMRGRCSAGQKVLASLIIRLALAEIFCSNCSVLALDEPTTNLDKANIISFANAITEIVKFRKKWKNTNFQLIIITHDEEFLRCLDSETGQYYYKVFKNDSGYSKILRKSINENYDDDATDQ